MDDFFKKRKINVVVPDRNQILFHLFFLSALLSLTHCGAGLPLRTGFIDTLDIRTFMKCG